MFNLGFTEILVLAILGLIILGPDQLPQMARKIARMLNEFKRATEDAMSPVNDLKKDAQDMIEKPLEPRDSREDDNNK